MVPRRSALSTLILYSLLMITVPIGTFFGSRRVLTEFIGVAESQSYIYAVAFTVIAIHIILGALLYEAYTEEVSLSAQQTDQKKEY